MSRIDKIIQKMKNRPNGMRFDEVKQVLEHHGYTMTKQNGTSHCHFRKAGEPRPITIKKDNPLKSGYVRSVLERIGE